MAYNPFPEDTLPQFQFLMNSLSDLPLTNENIPAYNSPFALHRGSEVITPGNSLASLPPAILAGLTPQDRAKLQALYANRPPLPPSIGGPVGPPAELASAPGAGVRFPATTMTGPSPNPGMLDEALGVTPLDRGVLNQATEAAYPYGAENQNQPQILAAAYDAINRNIQERQNAADLYNYHQQQNELGNKDLALREKELASKEADLKFRQEQGAKEFQQTMDLEKWKTGLLALKGEYGMVDPAIPGLVDELLGRIQKPTSQVTGGGSKPQSAPATVAPPVAQPAPQAPQVPAFGGQSAIGAAATNLGTAPLLPQGRSALGLISDQAIGKGGLPLNGPDQNFNQLGMLAKLWLSGGESKQDVKDIITKLARIKGGSEGGPGLQALLQWIDSQPEMAKKK